MKTKKVSKGTFMSKCNEGNPENFIALRPTEFKDFVSWEEWDSVSPETIETFVRIKKPLSKKSAYRKVRAYSALNKDEVLIGYRTKKLLKIDDGYTVEITKTNWFRYLWNHPESQIRHPFRIAIIFGAIQIALSVIALL